MLRGEDQAALTETGVGNLGSASRAEGLAGDSSLRTSATSRPCSGARLASHASRSV